MPKETATRLTHKQIISKTQQHPHDPKHRLCKCGGHLTLFGQDEFGCKGGKDTSPCDPSDVAKWLHSLCDSHEQSDAAPQSDRGQTLGGPRSVKEYADARKLPEEYVRGTWDLFDTAYKGVAAVGVPYDHDRRVVQYHGSKSDTNKCDKLVSYGTKIDRLYGLEVLRRQFRGLALLDGGYANVPPYLFIVEGAPDTQTMMYNHLPTLGAWCQGAWKAEWRDEPLLNEAQLIFNIQEPDDDTLPRDQWTWVKADKWTKKIAANLPAAEVRAVRLPSKDANQLWLDLWEEHGALGEEVVKPLFFNEIFAVCKRDTSILVSESVIENYELECMADVTMKDVEWLWKDRVPKGKLTIWGGAPGSCKSMATCSLAALVSTQGRFPDCDNHTPPVDVLMLFSEDDVQDTIAPRLKAAGADLNRIHRIKISCSKDATREQRELAFDRDRSLLERALVEHPEIRLVTVDPITSFIGDIDINKEQEVRSVLKPLADLAERADVTFVLVAHLNKRSDVTALNKILGAVAMTGVARATWMFAQDAEAEDDGEESYLMVRGKVNIAPKAPGIKFTVSAKEIEGLKNPVPFVVWGELTDISADKALDAFGTFNDTKGQKTAEATHFLEEFLAAGEKPESDVEQAAEAKKITLATLRRAKGKRFADVGSVKRGGQWFWYLKKTTKMTTPTLD